MLALADAVWAELLSETHRTVTVYELELDAATLYYAPQSLTWNSNTYTPLAVRQSPVKEDMAKLTAMVAVAFSNVTHTLRSQVEPADLITGKNMTVRLLFRDSGGSLLSDSVVLFKGEMERPRFVTESELEIEVVDPINAAGAEMPYRRTATWCPWQFANAGAYDGSGHCPYQQTTLADGAGASSTALTVDDGTDLVDGREIIIGSGSAVAIASGGGTTSITLAEARSWSDNDPVKYADCNREFSDCEKRAQEHRFGGFIAVANVARAQWRASGFADPQLDSGRFSDTFRF